MRDGDGAASDNVYIRKGVVSSSIDWPEKSQSLIYFSFKTEFFHYQTRASLESHRPRNLEKGPPNKKV